jgi:NAD(P)-dependent dehydrogenase (short-subunit alcohol dehydrogenase family)
MGRNLFDLTGKKALVTGGNSGLGLGFAVALAKGGADVVIWGRNEEKTAAAAKTLRAYGTRIESRLVDVSKEREVVEGMSAASRQMGRLDCVIANAGSVTISPFHEMTTETYNTLLDTAQHGGFYTLREAAKHMVARAEAGDPGGSLIVCGSLSIFAGGPNMAHYGTAKGALNSMSKGMAVDLGRYGIRVNVVAIGMTMTEMVQANIELAKPIIEMTARRNPLGRIGHTEDMEGIIIYLASDMSRYHTGDTITIDGGHRASIY